MTIRICCLLLIEVLVGQRAAGFSINRRADVVTRNNNAIISRQIIDHQLGSSRSKAANSFPSFTMMSTTHDDDDTDLSTSNKSRSSIPPKDKTINQSSVVKSVQDLMFGANYIHTNAQWFATNQPKPQYT